MRAGRPTTLLVCAGALLALPASSQAVTISVTSPADSGPGTLRAAVAEANTTPAGDEIAFAGSGRIPSESTITVTAPLEITGRPTGAGGAPQVQLDCIGAPGGRDGLEVAPGIELTVTRLSITGCDSAIAVRSGASLQLRSSWLGHSPGATVQRAMSAGVFAEAGASLDLGGPDPVDGNVIAASQVPVSAAQAATVTLRGNRIGVSPDGNQAASGPAGVIVGGTGPVTIAGNQIIGGQTAVTVTAPEAQLTGNVIGWTTDGESPAPLPSGGIVLGTGSSGGLVERNRVNAAGAAVAVQGESTRGVRVLTNALHSTTLPIDLGLDGPTRNDPADGDAGPNGRQNSPEISAAATTSVTSRIDSTPRTDVLIQTFAATADGRSTLTPLAETTATTDELGRALVAMPVTVPAGTPLVQTATTVDGTSEVSAPVDARDTSPVGGSLLPVVTPVPPASFQPIVTAPIPRFDLAVSKISSDGRRIIFRVKNAGQSTVQVQAGGTDQPASVRSKTPGAAFAVVSKRIGPGRKATFQLRVPAATVKKLRRALKRRRTTTYRPTVVVRNAATTATRTYSPAVLVRRAAKKSAR